MTTKKQKEEARKLVHAFHDHRHFQRIMEAFVNFEPDGDEDELTEEAQEFLEALEWALYTLKKQFVTVAAYTTLAKDPKHERAVSRLAQGLMAIPARFKTPPEKPAEPEKPRLRVINGGKN